MIGIRSFFYKAEISLWTASEQYLAFRTQVIPWPISSVWDVVFGEEN